MSIARSTLLFVGLNPPLTSGARTRERVELARESLGFYLVAYANLFAVATRDSPQLAEIGALEDGWIAARTDLRRGLRDADAVLLAYGLQPPSGPARTHFRAQVTWLEGEIEAREIPVWQVGGTPRHPSRWQRYTHRVAPGEPFRQTLREVLVARAPTAAASGSLSP